MRLPLKKISVLLMQMGAALPLMRHNNKPIAPKKNAAGTALDLRTPVLTWRFKTLKTLKWTMFLFQNPECLTPVRLLCPKLNKRHTSIIWQVKWRRRSLFLRCQNVLCLFLVLVEIFNSQSASNVQALLNRVNEEVTQFMKYLQDVSRICADDYSVIPQGALQYSEVFREYSQRCVMYLNIWA